MDSDTKADVYAQFVQEHVRNTRDMKKLLDALRNDMPEQKYPPQSDNSKRRVLKLIEVFLDVISGEDRRDTSRLLQWTRLPRPSKRDF